MDLFLILGGILLGLGLLFFIFMVLATFLIFAGPPDVHDVPITGTPKKKDKDV